MKKRDIFVLDVFTNGHDAAGSFIKTMGWKKEECNIVFCGNHKEVLNHLIQRESYAVVPVRNSIIGDVTEVMDNIEVKIGLGYDIYEVGRLTVSINHCLMVQEGVGISDITEVMSHPKALGQCKNFLQGKGLEHLTEVDSTGGAAKTVSQLSTGSTVAAIAPKSAAEEYGLKILQEGIQDEEGNQTKFLLLHNKCEVARKKVGIIGINGAFGRLLQKFFVELGCDVWGSDSSQPFSPNNEDVINWADVVIFSVTKDKTVGVINSLAHLFRKDQLVMDVTTDKAEPIKAMLKTKASVCGWHPMFRPEVGFEGQKIIICDGRINQNYPGWRTWILNVLAHTKADIFRISPKEHDEYMVAIQGGTHSENLTRSLLLESLALSAETALDLTSPVYRIQLASTGRMLASSNLGLYASILTDDVRVADMLESKIRVQQRLVRHIRNGEKDEIKKMLEFAKKYCGEEVIEQSDDLFKRLISIMNTLYGRNSRILEFPISYNKPGLLFDIMEIFKKRGINLTGINSVVIDDKLQFAVSFDQDPLSDEVRRALDEIESLKN
jgi:prephenate dehydratase